MSVTKSVVGCVAGILAGQGVLDPEAPVTTYVPEVAGSGYDGATVRHLLDMRTGVAFRETYVEPDAEVRVMERSMGWRPLLEGDPVGMYDYLTTLGTPVLMAATSPTAPRTPTCSAGCVVECVWLLDGPLLVSTFWVQVMLEPRPAPPPSRSMPNCDGGG